MKGCSSEIITMTGWTDDMVCYFIFLKEGLLNKHPSMCSAFFFLFALYFHSGLH